jgi:hypothetical protein
VSNSNNNRTANSTTAGKLQKFYKEHSTPSGTSAAAASLTAGRLSGPHKFKKGDDVLQHCAQNGLDAAPKLVHCLQASAAAGTAQHAAGTADPYDLTVVPRAQLPACYCTLTATGVVQVCAVSQYCTAQTSSSGGLLPVKALASMDAPSEHQQGNGHQACCLLCVVQVPGDGEPSQHTPIGTWLRHASLHQVFAGLPAGQYMLKNSVLHRWVGRLTAFTPGAPAVLTPQASRQRLDKKQLQITGVLCWAR